MIDWDEGDAPQFPVLRRLSVTIPETLRSLPKELGCRPGSRYLEAMTDKGSKDAASSPVALDPGGDLSNWEDLIWYDRRSGLPIRVTTDRANLSDVMLETLDLRAANWSKSPRHLPISLVRVKISNVRYVGRVSGVIDAQADGLLGTLQDYRPIFQDANRLAALHRIARPLGPAVFARRTGLSMSVAKRVANGQGISGENITRAEKALRSQQFDDQVCALDECGHVVRRKGAQYCSCKDHHSHQGLANKRRQQATHAALKGRPG